MNLDSFKHQFRNILKDLPKICLLGIRNYTRGNAYGDSPSDLYDDCIVRCIDNEIKIFEASVDPGSYFINHPMNPQGCARLKCGLWYYQLGEHHAHRALVQADEVTVHRIDKAGIKRGEETGFFGINIHSGGQEYLVGRYSAGCQVIKAGEAWKFQWTDFFEPIETGMKKSGQTRIPYLLVDKLEAIPVASDS